MVDEQLVWWRRYALHSTGRKRISLLSKFRSTGKAREKWKLGEQKNAKTRSTEVHTEGHVQLPKASVMPIIWRVLVVVLIMKLIEYFLV